VNNVSASAETLFTRGGIVYMNLQPIYSGNGVRSFTRIAPVLQEILPKTFWSHFFGDTL